MPWAHGCFRVLLLVVLACGGGDAGDEPAGETVDEDTFEGWSMAEGAGTDAQRGLLSGFVDHVSSQTRGGALRADELHSGHGLCCVTPLA